MFYVSFFCLEIKMYFVLYFILYVYVQEFQLEVVFVLLELVGFFCNRYLISRLFGRFLYNVKLFISIMESNYILNKIECDGY